MGLRAARPFRGKTDAGRDGTDPTGAHPEHEIQLLLPGRAVAERRQHATEVHEVQILEHLHDARGERRDGQLGDAHQLILAEVTLVSLVQRSEALVQRLDLAMVKPPAALFLYLLHVVLRQVQTRRCQAHRPAPRVRTLDRARMCAHEIRRGKPGGLRDATRTMTKKVIFSRIGASCPLLVASTFPPSTPLLTLLHPPHEHLLARHVREHQHLKSRVHLRDLDQPLLARAARSQRVEPRQVRARLRRRPTQPLGDSLGETATPAPPFAAATSTNDATRDGGTVCVVCVVSAPSVPPPTSAALRERTAMPNMSDRRSAGFAASALPMAFRSEHKEPVGMDTSRFTPR